MSAVLLQGDCLEVMKTLPDKSIDCFICDLPYGQLHPGRNDEGKWWDRPCNACAWDVKIDLAQFWTHVKRLAKDKHTPILMFCNTRFGYELIKSNETWYRYDIVWSKKRGVSFLSANKQPLRSHEMIYVFSKAGAYYKRIDKSDRKCVLSVLQILNCKKRGNHPTEKPKEIYKWLLERYCPTGGTVLDPTAGSFNSVAVAKEMGLKAIGIEKDEGFFKKAQEKLAGPDLPTEPPRNEVVFTSD